MSQKLEAKHKRVNDFYSWCGVLKDLIQSYNKHFISNESFNGTNVGVLVHNLAVKIIFGHKKLTMMIIRLYFIESMNTDCT